MSLMELTITAAASSTIVVFAAGLVAWLFKAAVARWIQHQFDRPLEEFKSGLKVAEEAKKAELAAINSRADALQNNIFAALRDRSGVLDRRRIEAAERVWATVVELRPLEQASVAAQTIKLDKAMEVAAQHTEEGQKVREFAATISNAMGFSFEKFKPLTHVADKERPFVSPMTWALFSTYRSVVVDPVFRFGVIKAGGSPELIKDNAELAEAVKEALPHYKGFIEEHGTEAIAFLVDDLREKSFQGADCQPKQCQLGSPRMAASPKDRSGARQKLR